MELYFYFLDDVSGVSFLSFPTGEMIFYRVLKYWNIRMCNKVKIIGSFITFQFNSVIRI